MSADVPKWKLAFEKPEDMPDASIQDGVLAFKCLDGSFVWFALSHYSFGFQIETAQAGQKYFILTFDNDPQERSKPGQPHFK